MQKFTTQQQNVIDYRGKNLLVSASAGTGKTTVMIERIAKLIEDGADVSSMVVVTYTNLAAAEMRNRLALKLAEKRNNPRIVEQLEKLDMASICTIHSFCGDLLRSYFYVVDLDPAFAIFDSATAASLSKAALDEVCKQYFQANDEDFLKLHQIFSTGGDKDFRDTIVELYNFARCLDDFSAWYQQKRSRLLDRTNNPYVKVVQDDMRARVTRFAESMQAIVAEARNNGEEDLASKLDPVAEQFCHAANGSMEDMFNMFSKVAFPRKAGLSDFGLALWQDVEAVKDDFSKYKDSFKKWNSGRTFEQMWQNTEQSVFVTDKLVEVLGRFDAEFSAQKRQRGGVDFGDLEHLTLQLLQDEEALASIRQRYTMLFVDEYQDTNPVQDAIVSRLADSAQLFMVGDVKQSIYGFRGCDSSIFLSKYNTFGQTDEGHVEELNANFRSNNEILSFVNDVFDNVMTESLGKVDYRARARLEGSGKPVLDTPSVQLDLLVKQKQSAPSPTALYDITAEKPIEQKVSQGNLIAQRINQYVGMPFVDDKGRTRHIDYGDIVILMRGLTNAAQNIYTDLVENNIPVAASFKATGYLNKEVRDLITLLRVLDNPYNDIYMASACLAPYGGFDEQQLAQIKIATNSDEQRFLPFFERMQLFADTGEDEALADKIKSFHQYVKNLRFFATSATVDEIALRVIRDKQYNLYVQGLPNGTLRLAKLQNFIDGLKGMDYAQSVDRFLSYLDDLDENRPDEGIADVNAVRLMTMHSSKGLEFPIVILAWLEKEFKFDYPAVARNNDFGLAANWYDFDARRKAETFGTVAINKVVNKHSTMEEELRLLYVAMTRPKWVLHLVGTVDEDVLTKSPPRPDFAKSHLDWLLFAVRTKYGAFNTGLDQPTFRLNVLYGLDVEQAEQRTLLCKQRTDADAILQQLQYRYPFASQKDMPSKVVSSALDREYIDVDQSRAEAVLSANNDRNFVGTAYHKVYQFVNWDADEQQICATIEGLVNEGLVEPQYAAQLDVSLIHATLHNKQLRKLMSQGKVYHELPFMLVAPYDKVAVDKRFSDEVMLQGVIDMLVLAEHHAVVVDFKYSTHSADLLQRDYTAQLNSYRLAVQTICGVTDVDCYILSIARNQLIKMP